MEVRRCDRCGKTIGYMYDGYELTVKTGDYRIAYDICDDCYMEFVNKFMITESEDQNDTTT